MRTHTRFWTERRGVAALSLLATYLFFAEYLPPIARVHLYSDIEGYHYALLHYTFASLKHGHLPEWDPTIYCGLPLIGNVQAAALYPPNWMMFAANAGRKHLSYMGLEALVILHLWLAFFLCYVWFRGRRLDSLASALGGAVYAFGGYAMSQDNHVGVICGVAWTPLALWGIDEAVSLRFWRPLWKVAAASALCFLAGYPPTWVVFCFVVVVYALASQGRWRAAAGALAALAFSVLLFAAQLLPALAALGLKAPEDKYSFGLRQAEFFIAYLVPNYFDLGTRPFGWGFPPGTYLYVGAPALFGIAWLIFKRNLKIHLQAIVIAVACAIMVLNPLGLVRAVLVRSRLLIQVCHAFNFLEGLTVAAALIAAVSVHDLLSRKGRRAPPWLLPVAVAALAAWSARQFIIWLPGGTDFAARWWSGLDAAVILALFWAGLWALRGATGPRRAWAAVALLAAVFVDFKVFGTSRGFDAVPGRVDRLYPGNLQGIDDKIYNDMLAHPEYRLALDEDASPHSTSLRHFGLTTPQGFDPFLPDEYRKWISARVPFRSDRVFWLRPQDEELLRMTAVRYFITMPGKPSDVALKANPDFRLMEPAQSYFNVFEYRKAEPPYGWDCKERGQSTATEPVGQAVSPAGRRSMAVDEDARSRLGTGPRPRGGNSSTEHSSGWESGRREFVVKSRAGGRFFLAEQFFPGWHAFVDGREAQIERWNRVFQAVKLGPGEHRVRFVYRTPGLRIGAVISATALLLLVYGVRATRSAPK